MLRIALDTNTIISGLFFDGNEREMLVAGLSGKFQLVLSQDILEEVEAIVARKFSGDKDLDAALAFLYDIAMSSEFHQEAFAHEGVSPVRDAEDAVHYAFILGEKLTARVQEMLDERTRANMWVFEYDNVIDYNIGSRHTLLGGAADINWYSASGWRARTRDLFDAAAEVARALGEK